MHNGNPARTSIVRFPTRSNGVLRLEIDEADTVYLFGKPEWTTHKRSDGEVVLVRTQQVAGKRIRTFLHRLIADKHVRRESSAHTHCVFRDGNPYNLARANLRWATAEEVRSVAGAQGWRAMLAAKRVTAPTA